MAKSEKLPENTGKNWLIDIKDKVVKEGFPNPSKSMSNGLTIDAMLSKSLAREYEFFEGWYVRAKVKALECYIKSRSTGTSSKEYCAYKFYDMLESCYESRVKRISREYSRREQEHREARL